MDLHKLQVQTLRDGTYRGLLLEPAKRTANGGRPSRTRGYRLWPLTI